MKSVRYLFFVLLALCSARLHALDLSDVRKERLPNGLTIMILEEHALPVVSTQMLYKVGSRNECTGATGLAHYVEHMAFRATKNFPNSDVVSRIYAVGGEWHGYTWIDQTTYFETVPKQYLDMVLRIQADRMSSVVNDPDEFEAERGSVITELHSYENDPASVLYDAVLAVAFQQHPYRYNVIGWLSDVQNITHKDIVEFYRRFYNPSNAVLAIAGDVNAEETLQLARKYFGAIPGSDITSAVRTVEPEQNGERRVAVRGTGSYHYFQITYRAPAAKQADYPAFLLLQALLSGSGGVNFEQRGSGETARPGSRLHGIGESTATFFQPTADPYAIDITGYIPSSESTSSIENAVEEALRKLREEPVTEQELQTAKDQVKTALVFDIETTENAAHQMAFFEGIGAYEVLLQLPELVSAVTPERLQEVARKYLSPQQRTVGWYLADQNAPGDAAFRAPSFTQRAMARQAPAADAGPRVRTLKNDIALIVQRISRTPTGFLRIVVPTNSIDVPAESATDLPAYGYTSIEFPFRKEKFAETAQKAAALWQQEVQLKKEDAAGLENPESRLELELLKALGIEPRNAGATPVLVLVSGDVAVDEAIRTLQQSFAALPAAPRAKAAKPPLTSERIVEVKLPGKPQSQLGYAVPVAAPHKPESYAYRLLLYIMSHGYEGRMGKELIGRRGLIYYIDSNYRTDGRNGWITMTAGVDAGKLREFREAFSAKLQDLRTNLPSEEEVAEAKQHLIGRRLTGYQSNEELTSRHALEWIEFGRLLTQQEFEKNVNSVTLEQVRSIVPSFLNGVTVVVDTN